MTGDHRDDYPNQVDHLPDPREHRAAEAGEPRTAAGRPEEPTWLPQGIDRDQPSVARVYDYLLGGGHNFAVDRELAARIEAVQANVVLAENAIHAGQMFVMQFGLSVWSRHPAVAPDGDRRRASVECAVRRTGTAAGVFACEGLGVRHLGCGGVPPFGGGWGYYPLCEFSGCPFVRARPACWPGGGRGWSGVGARVGG
ncbi:SAM-dependent methyltransferase [Actinosynnema sp. NPDC023658]|uniref:SAM-dependent methyltransferase n=1 Tax=Actinosynnema sp. NPDC023658 TaxID=3155465 RepID=UPI00340BE262